MLVLALPHGAFLYKRAPNAGFEILSERRCPAKHTSAPAAGIITAGGTVFTAIRRKTDGCASVRSVSPALKSTAHFIDSRRKARSKNGAIRHRKDFVLP